MLSTVIGEKKKKSFTQKKKTKQANNYVEIDNYYK